MPLYLYQAAGTAESVAAQIKGATGPHRGGHARVPGHGRHDGAGAYPLGEAGVLILFEAPDDTTAARL